MLVSVGLGLSTLAAVALIQGNVRATKSSSSCRPTRPASSSSTSRTTSWPASKQLVARSRASQDMQQVPSAARAHRRGERRAGRAGARHARYALGAARRPRPDLCRHAAGGHAAGRRHTGGRPTTAGRRWCRSTPASRRGWGVGIGDTIRVNVLGRDIDLRIASLRDIAWQIAVAQLRHGGQPGPAGSTRRTPTSPRSAWPTPDQGGAAAGGDRRAAQRHRHPGGGRARRGRRAAGSGRPRRWPPPAR